MSRKGITKAPNGKKSAYITMGIFMAPDGAIHLTGKDFHTWVFNKEGSKRTHKNLYKHLSRALKSVGLGEEL